VQGRPPFPFADQSITLYGLLRSDATAGEPLQLGIVVLGLVALALFGLFAGDTLADGEVRRLFGLAEGAVAVGILIALPWAQPLWRWTGAEQLFSAPWQPLLVTGALLAAVAGAVPLLFSEWRRTLLWTATVLALLVGAQGALTPSRITVEPPEQPLAIVGDNDLALMQASVQTSLADGVPAALLSLQWQAMRPLPADDNLFFQAVIEPADGGEPEVVAQLDVPPVADAPAGGWQRGQIFSELYLLPLPEEVNVADLTYYVGFYDWRDGTRRPITLGSAAAPIGAVDKLVLNAE
jgi:hypothetical protein